MHDITITDVATAGVLFGGLAAWILSNERRTAALERSREEAIATVLRVDTTIAAMRITIEALHERLDEYFTGREKRPPREKP